MREGRVVGLRLQAAARVMSLSGRAEQNRLAAAGLLEEGRQVEWGQFLTSQPIARLMASMIDDLPSKVHLLDAGAGTGALCAGLVDEICGWERRPDSLSLTAYEIDPALQGALRDTLAGCAEECDRHGIVLTKEQLQEDFIEAGVAHLRGAVPTRAWNCAILNPPYRKIHSASAARSLLRSVGIETSNLYTGFLALALKLLEPDGQLCAITPRSFCNGPYFLSFRRLLLESATLRRIHVFDSRDRAFRQDQVLQENVIFVAVKRAMRHRQVILSASRGPGDPIHTQRLVPYEEVVRSGDPQEFIHIPSRPGRPVSEDVPTQPATLGELGIAVATGKVVDFRVREFLRKRRARDTAPLIYPVHLSNGRVRFPVPGFRKPQHLSIKPATEQQLLPSSTYVLVKRFSSKEQRRRITAVVYDERSIPEARWVGFENHLNVYHATTGTLNLQVASGLCAYLNSTAVDDYFRRFSGHTQVNATDLRSLRYPDAASLMRLGAKLGDAGLPTQEELDQFVEQVLVGPPAGDRAD